MACATLKRAYDWDPLNSPNQSAAGPSVSSASASKSTMNSPSTHTPSFTTSSTSAPSYSHHHSHRPSKRRCLFSHHHQQNHHHNHHHNYHSNHSVRSVPPKPASPFATLQSKFAAEDIAASIKQEMQRLHNRKQLYFTSNNSSSGDLNLPSTSESSFPLEQQQQSTSSDFDNTFSVGLLSPSRRDQPLFTFRQVNLICERLLKERESLLRDEYDQILTTKLAEQYDTFVKFTYDQIQKRFDTGGTPSYLS